MGQTSKVTWALDPNYSLWRSLCGFPFRGLLFWKPTGRGCGVFPACEASPPRRGPGADCAFRFVTARATAAAAAPPPCPVVRSVFVQGSRCLAFVQTSLPLVFPVHAPLLLHFPSRRRRCFRRSSHCALILPNCSIATENPPSGLPFPGFRPPCFQSGPNL